MTPYLLRLQGFRKVLKTFSWKCWVTNSYKQGMIHDIFILNLNSKHYYTCHSHGGVWRCLRWCMEARHSGGSGRKMKSTKNWLWYHVKIYNKIKRIKKKSGSIEREEGHIVPMRSVFIPCRCWSCWLGTPHEISLYRFQSTIFFCCISFMDIILGISTASARY